MKENIVICIIVSILIALAVAYIFVGPYAPVAGNDDSQATTCETAPEETDDHLAILAAWNTNAPKRQDKHILVNNIYLQSTEASENVISKPTKLVNLPIGYDVQRHIFELCEKYDLDPMIVFAIIQKESRCTPNASGDGGRSSGLMQIQKKWHSGRMQKLGCNDLMNPYQNVTVGIDILVELYKYNSRSRSTEWVLMAYNAGAKYANDKVAAGEVSDYARSVLKIARGLEVTYET
jgi:soluble lytic murein transglycosylase-like protein